MQRRLTFSQRFGYESLPPQMQRGEISKELRISLWNKIYRLLDKQVGGLDYAFWQGSKLGEIVRNIVAEFKKTTIDSVEPDPGKALLVFRDTILNDKFNRVLDLLEMLSRIEGFIQIIRYEFENFGAPFRICIDDGGHAYFVECSTDEECDAVLNSLEMLHQNGMPVSTEKLKQAAKAIRESRYQDSVANSYMALEAAARHVAPIRSSTLGKALHALGSKEIMSPHLVQAMESLSSYANSQEGVRHSGGIKSNTEVGPNEAIAMFGACACFSSYLCNLRK